MSEFSNEYCDRDGTRVYLDHAATSWPKCAEAVEAAAAYVRDCGATAGRGAYRSALAADAWLEQARSQLSQLIGAARSTDIAMCFSGTHALNAALHGILQPGDHVITTTMEHNSVLRPLKQMEKSLGIQFSVVEADQSGRASAESARSLLQGNTKLLAIGHASNVTGAVNDLNSWSALAKECGSSLMVDASQTLGYIPVHVDEMGIDVLAAAGHKGLRALAGTGLLFVRNHLQSNFRPAMFGGTGRFSESIDDHPQWPQTVEVGNLNMPGIVSMAVAAKAYVDDPTQIQAWKRAFGRLSDGLLNLDAVHVLGMDRSTIGNELEELDLRIPVASIQVEGWDIHDLASVLDASFQIEVRAGYHCAALIHSGLGSAASGGTLRLSTGHSTTPAQVESTLRAFAELLGV